jgi:hypothetical protein
MCGNDKPLDLQQSGTFQVIVPISQQIANSANRVPLDQVTIPISLAGQYKLELKFVELSVKGVTTGDVTVYDIINSNPIVTFTSPNFSVPMTVSNALTYYNAGIFKTGDVNGMSVILEPQFQQYSNAHLSLKTIMSKKGPPHYLLASIYNSFTVQPMYLKEPNSTNYQTTSEFFGSPVATTVLGGSNGVYILTFSYDKI